jgi:photoactive yellow protein
MELTALLALTHLSASEFETASYGGIVVDRTGLVQRYNASETAISQLAPERVIGKNFFHHVAPCTAVRAFEGRFQDFIASDEIATAGLNYFFPFSHGDCDVYVSFVKLHGSYSILIVIERIEAAHSVAH